MSAGSGQVDLADIRRPAPHGGRLLWMDGFVPEEECALVLDELQFAYWSASTVIRRESGGALQSVRSAGRVSESTTEHWFSRELARCVRRIERRVAGLVHRPVDRFERWQATRYGRGGRFRDHFDCGFWGQEPAGEREKTVLIYLDTPARGGSTYFKELGLEVMARRGRLVVWNNLEPDGTADPAMLHRSVPVARGRKTTLVTWIRQRPIRTAEQRRQ